MDKENFDSDDNTVISDEIGSATYVKHRTGEPVSTLVGDEPILIEGSLMKRSDRGKWQTRWFVLHGQTLSYYNKNKPTHGASIDLWRVNGVTLQNDRIILEIPGRKVPRMHKMARSISNFFSPDAQSPPNDSQFEIRCSSPKEAQIWLQAIYSRPLEAVGQWSPSSAVVPAVGDEGTEEIPLWRRLSVSSIRVVHNGEVLDRIEGVEGLIHGTNFVLSEDLYSIPLRSRVELQLTSGERREVVGHCSAALPQLYSRNSASLQMPIVFESDRFGNAGSVIVQVNLSASSTPRSRSRMGVGRKEQLLLADLDMGILAALGLLAALATVLLAALSVPAPGAAAGGLVVALVAVKGLVSNYVLVREMLRGLGNSINSLVVQRQLVVTDVFIAPPGHISSYIAAPSHSMLGQITTDILASITKTPSHFPGLKRRISASRRAKRASGRTRAASRRAPGDRHSVARAFRSVWRSRSSASRPADPAQRQSSRLEPGTESSADQRKESERRRSQRVEYNVKPDHSIAAHERPVIEALREVVAPLVEQQLTSEDRESVRKYVDADFRLVRFLRGNHMSVPRAAEQFRAAMEWRVAFGADRLLETLPPEWLLAYASCPVLKDMLLQGAPRRPWYLVDLDNHLSAYYRGGRCNWKKLFAKLDHDGELLFRSLMFLVEAITVDMDAAHAESNGRMPSGISAVFDMEGFAMSHQISLPRAVRLARKYLHQFTTAYPEVLHRIEVVNAPWLFSSMWSAFTPFIPPEVLEKIHITSPKNLVERVHSLLPPHQIPDWVEGGLLTENLEQRIAPYGPYSADGGNGLLRR